MTETPETETGGPAEGFCVARINLDGGPSAETLAAIQSGNADVLNLQVVRL